MEQIKEELLVDTKDIVLCAYEAEGVVHFGYFRCEYFRSEEYGVKTVIQLLRGFDNPYTTAISHTKYSFRGYEAYENIAFFDENGNDINLVSSCELISIIGSYEELRKGKYSYDSIYPIGMDSRTNMNELLDRVATAICLEAKKCGDACELFAKINNIGMDNSYMLLDQLRRGNYDNVKHTLTRTIVRKEN